MIEVSREDRFLFDLQGFLLLPGVLQSEECERYLQTLARLQEADYDDS